MLLFAHIYLKYIKQILSKQKPDALRPPSSDNIPDSQCINKRVVFVNTILIGRNGFFAESVHGIFDPETPI